MFTDLHNINTVWFYMTFVCIFAWALLLALFLRSGRGYSVHDTEAHATDYAKNIKEGHGGMTAFLWLLYGTMFIWTIVYFAQHASDFRILFP